MRLQHQGRRFRATGAAALAVPLIAGYAYHKGAWKSRKGSMATMSQTTTSQNWKSRGKG